MLQTQTVEPGTFSLLKHLMDLPQLKDFSLVGGTALSLRYGHRKSIDLDLFSENNFKRIFKLKCHGLVYIQLHDK